jgi:hypothetical protein
LSASVFSEALNRHAAGRGTTSWHERLTHMGRMMRTGVGIFLTEGDTVPINVPGEPMLDAITGPLTALAVVLALWRWRQPWRMGLLAAALLTFAGITFFPNNLYVGRFFVLLVPLFGLLGLRATISCWRRARAWLGVLGIGAVALATPGVRHQRIIDHPRVRFISCLKRRRRGRATRPSGQVVMLTDGAQRSAIHYLWYTAGAHRWAA